MARIMGLDVGTKTIGVAVSDGLEMLAHPVCTLSRRGVKKDVEMLLPLMGEHDVSTLIVGLPLELDGTEERSARLARQIGAEARARTGVPVYYVDERFTSVDAERQLIEVHMRREQRKAVIDQQAAVLILQSFLDGRDGAIHDQEA